MNKKTKKGFTITELVIVIAVIAILAAVLIPTFSNVIKNANESVALQEARSEWDNFAPEIATETEKGDYLIKYEKDEKTTYYFLVNDGQLDTTAIAKDKVTITAGTDNKVSIVLKTTSPETTYGESKDVQYVYGYEYASKETTGTGATPTTVKTSHCTIYKLLNA